MTAPTLNFITDASLLLPYQNSVINKPYTYMTIEVGGTVYDITDYILQSPLIDRQARILPETISELRASDAVFTVSNDDKFMSPTDVSSIFYKKNYFNSKITIYTGFWTSDTEVMLISQLVSYLSEIDISADNNTLKLICTGVTKKLERKKVGEPLTDGTANPKTYTGTQYFKSIIEDLLSNYGGLIPSEYSVQDIDITFDDIVFTNISVSSAISYLCQAVSATIYEDRFGKISIQKLEITWDNPISSSTIDLDDTNNIVNAHVIFSDENLLYKISVTGNPSTVYSEHTETINVSGRIVSVSNNYIQTEAIAQDIVSRFKEIFCTTPILLELDIDYMPALDVGTICLVTEEQSGMVSEEFEIYRVSLDIENYTGRVYLQKSYYIGANFGFYASDNAEGADPEVADDYDLAGEFDLKFAYYGDENVTDDTPPKYSYAR